MIGYTTSLGAGEIKALSVKVPFCASYEATPLRKRLRLLAAILQNKKLDPPTTEGPMGIGSLIAFYNAIAEVPKIVSDIAVQIEAIIPGSRVRIQARLNKLSSWMGKLGKYTIDPLEAETNFSLIEPLILEKLPDFEAYRQDTLSWICNYNNEAEKILELTIHAAALKANIYMSDPATAANCQIDLRSSIDGGSDKAVCEYRVKGKGSPYGSDSRNFLDGNLEKWVYYGNACQYGGVFDLSDNKCHFDVAILPPGVTKGADIVPLTQKWWFWGLVIVGVGGAGYGVYRWKFKK